MKIIIDGENFRHQLAKVLVDSGKIDYSQHNNFFRFDIEGFLADVLPKTKKSEVLYIATRIKQPKFKIPHNLSKKLTKIAGENRKWVAQLSNQNIGVVKAGQLRVKESVTCYYCSKRTLVPQEKGVDVRVATEILLSAHRKEPVALFCSDSDVLPAIMATKSLGGQLTYVALKGSQNRAIAGQCSNKIWFTPEQVLKYHKEDNV